VRNALEKGDFVMLGAPPFQYLPLEATVFCNADSAATARKEAEEPFLDYAV